MFDKNTIVEKSGKPIFSTTLAVRINDVNFGNHLDYAALLEMVGNARSLWFKENECNEIDLGGGVGLVTKSLHVEYKAESFFNDKLEFSLYVLEMKGPKAILHFDVSNTETAREVASVSMQLVFINLETGKPTRVPEKFKSMSGV